MVPARRFLAAEAEHTIARPQRRGDDAHDPLQHDVAGGMAEAVVEALEMVDVDDEQAERPAGQSCVLHTLPAQMLEPAAIERTGQRVASRAGQQILVALAIGQQVEHVDDARRMLAVARKLDQAEVDRAERGVDRDRRHFRNPAAEQHGKRRAGEETRKPA